MANIRGSSVQSRGQLTEDIQKDSGGSRADVFSAGWSDNKAFWRDFKRDTPGAVLESDEDSDTDVERLASEGSDDALDDDWEHQHQHQHQRWRHDGDGNESFGHYDDVISSSGPRYKARRRDFNRCTVVDENASNDAADTIAADVTADDFHLANAPDAHPNLSRFRRIRREYRRRVRRRDRTMIGDYGEAAAHVTFYSIATLILVHYVGYWKPMVDLARVEFRLIFVLAALATVLFAFEFFLACKPLFFTRRRGPTVVERPRTHQGPTTPVQAAAEKATKPLRTKGRVQIRR